MRTQSSPRPGVRASAPPAAARVGPRRGPRVETRDDWSTVQFERLDLDQFDDQGRLVGDLYANPADAVPRRRRGR